MLLAAIRPGAERCIIGFVCKENAIVACSFLARPVDGRRVIRGLGNRPNARCACARVVAIEVESFPEPRHDGGLGVDRFLHGPRFRAVPDGYSLRCGTAICALRHW